MAKNQFIRARVAGWEKDCIRRKADAAHMTESEFVRRAAMDREVTVIEGMDELLRELRYQGNNLNQLTVMARQGRITQVNYEPFTEVYVLRDKQPHGLPCGIIHQTIKGGRKRRAVRKRQQSEIPLG